VREFVLKAIELKVGQSEPIGEKDRARLNLDASGTQIEFAASPWGSAGTGPFTVNVVAGQVVPSGILIQGLPEV